MHTTYWLPTNRKNKIRLKIKGNLHKYPKASMTFQNINTTWQYFLGDDFFLIPFHHYFGMKEQSGYGNVWQYFYFKLVSWKSRSVTKDIELVWQLNWIMLKIHVSKFHWAAVIYKTFIITTWKFIFGDQTTYS